MASWPLTASPTTSMSGCALSRMEKPDRTMPWSSATTRGSSRRLLLEDGLTGRTAATRNPPSSVGPASRLPPSIVARSRMPTRPCPPPCGVVPAGHQNRGDLRAGRRYRPRAPGFRGGNPGVPGPAIPARAASRCSSPPARCGRRTGPRLPAVPRVPLQVTMTDTPPLRAESYTADAQAIKTAERAAIRDPAAGSPAPWPPGPPAGAVLQPERPGRGRDGTRQPGHGDADRDPGAWLRHHAGHVLLPGTGISRWRRRDDRRRGAQARPFARGSGSRSSPGSATPPRPCSARA